MKNFIILLLFLYLHSALAIEGGNYVPWEDPDSRYMVMLTGHGSLANHADCSGVVIAQDLILTAAHCIPIQENIELYISFASRAPYRVHAIVPTTKYRRHENYQGSRFVVSPDDIGLMYFKSGLPQGVVPIVLPSKDEPLFLGMNLSLLAYGASLTPPPNYHKLLNKPWEPGVSELPKFSFVKRADFKVRSFDIENKKVKIEGTEFAGSKNNITEVCQGDSGGPIVTGLENARKLVGIVVNFDSIGFCNSVANFTQVSAYLDWISKTAEELRK